MDFQVLPLERERFAPLFGLDDDALAAQGARRVVARMAPGSRYPCRVSLEDARDGEPVLLVNFEHLPQDTPYRSRFAIYVREGAVAATPAVNEVPAVMRGRPLALRAFDARGMLLGAELAQDEAIAPVVSQLFSLPGADFLHVHNARHGCYVARIERTGGTAGG